MLLISDEFIESAREDPPPFMGCDESAAPFVSFVDICSNVCDDERIVL